VKDRRRIVNLRGTKVMDRRPAGFDTADLKDGKVRRDELST